MVFNNNYVKVDLVMNLVSADLLANHMVNFRINQEFPWTLLNWVTYDLSTWSVINTSCLDEDRSVDLDSDWIRVTVITNMCIDIFKQKSSQPIRISNRKFSMGVTLFSYVQWAEAVPCSTPAMSHKV